MASPLIVWSIKHLDPLTVWRIWILSYWVSKLNSLLLLSKSVARSRCSDRTSTLFSVWDFAEGEYSCGLRGVWWAARDRSPCPLLWQRTPVHRPMNSTTELVTGFLHDCWKAVAGAALTVGKLIVAENLVYWWPWYIWESLCQPGVRPLWLPSLPRRYRRCSARGWGPSRKPACLSVQPWFMEELFKMVVCWCGVHIFTGISADLTSVGKIKPKAAVSDIAFSSTLYRTTKLPYNDIKPGLGELCTYSAELRMAPAVSQSCSLPLAED